jgi:hypothetical protein
MELVVCRPWAMGGRIRTSCDLASPIVLAGMMKVGLGRELDMMSLAEVSVDGPREQPARRRQPMRAGGAAASQFRLSPTRCGQPPLLSAALSLCLPSLARQKGKGHQRVDRGRSLLNGSGRLGRLALLLLPEGGAKGDAQPSATNDSREREEEGILECAEAADDQAHGLPVVGAEVDVR